SRSKIPRGSSATCARRSWSRPSSSPATRGRSALAEGPLEEAADRLFPIGREEPRPRAREARAADARLCGRLPAAALPLVPALALLVVDVDRLPPVLGELGRPSGAALDGVVREDRPHHEHLAGGVYLVPDRLDHLLEERRHAVVAVHAGG